MHMKHMQHCNIQSSLQHPCNTLETCICNISNIRMQHPEHERSKLATCSKYEKKTLQRLGGGWRPAGSSSVLSVACPLLLTRGELAHRSSRAPGRREQRPASPKSPAHVKLPHSWRTLADLGCAHHLPQGSYSRRDSPSLQGAMAPTMGGKQRLVPSLEGAAA
jgi:hypothetical protein